MCFTVNFNLLPDNPSQIHTVKAHIMNNVAGDHTFLFKTRTSLFEQSNQLFLSDHVPMVI